MRTKILAQYIIILALLGGVLSCENPLKDFNLIVGTDVIRHATIVEVLSTDGQAVDAKIKLLAGDVQDVYNLSGYKEFKLVGNQVTFGLDPKREPTAADPIQIDVEISAEGYHTQIVQVSITAINNGIMPVRLAKKNELPTGAVSITKTAALNDKVALSTGILLEAVDPNGVTVHVNVPAGTQFLDAAGKVIQGKAISLTVIAYDPLHPATAALFPGGRFQADGVERVGQAPSSGTFNPAVSANVQMTIDGVPVRRFSNPIHFEMFLSDSFLHSTAGSELLGTNLSTFTYSSFDPVWRHEIEAPVQQSGGNYAVSFTVDHLTTFLVGEFMHSCAPISQVNFTADWMDQGFTYPILVEAVKNGQVIASRLFSVNANNKSIALDYLPATGVSIVVRSTLDNSIIAQADLAACGSQTNVTLQNPFQPGEPKVTLQLYVRCPDKSSTVTVLPTFQLYYRLAGTGSFKLLGEVDNGFLSTSFLKTDGTKYDFRAVWDGKTKTVNGKTVQVDNSGTIGIKPGDIIGEKVGATNLEILTEECAKL